MTADELASWERWLCPLPKQVELIGKVIVPVERLRVRTSGSASILDDQLSAELSAALEEKTGVKPDLAAGVGPGDFVLDFRRRDEDKTLLADRVHPDQAYILETVTDDGQVTLACRALSETGSLFGMRTLRQLLVASVQGAGQEATVGIPVGRITDWPDMEERGQWGGSVAQDLEWLAGFKHNLIELHANLSIDAQGVAHAKMNEEVMERARKLGVRVVPIIHHLEQLENTGLFKFYPQLRATEVENSNSNLKPLCFSQPDLLKPLSQWLTELGQIPDVSEVMIWLSEEGKGCGCDACRQNDRFVNELNACVAAWRLAKETCPDLGLRVLLTQASYPSNAAVLKALPEDVKVSYYDGGRTYNTDRAPMIYPVLEEYLKQGRWMGVYPTLSANWLSVAPFSNPEFVKYRMTEFVDKGLQCLVAYIVPTAWLFRVNTEAGLEWSWNAHGRSEREFAVSFAVRHGMADPEKFADWTQLVGPPAWDLYASRFPYLENWGAPTAKIASGRMKFGLGQSMFAAFKSPEQFADNLAQLDEALTLARELGDDEYIAETVIVRGYTQVLQAVWELSQIMRGDEGVAPENLAAAEKWLKSCQEGLDSLIAAYPTWSDACLPDTGAKKPDRYSSTVTLMEKLSANMGELMEEIGVQDEGKPYRMHVIGSWKTEDFAEQGGITKRLDVTEFVNGAGTYWFRPTYRRGSLGLTASQVALVSYAKDKPDELREEAVDRHDCHAGAWVKDDVYLLPLKEYAPERGYAVLAHVRGGDSTEGDFLFRKVKQ